MGPNGSGKSTLARLLKGLVAPDSGELSIDGVDGATAEGRRALRERVGLVFENPSLQIVAPTVEEDLLFGLENLGVAAAEAERRLRRVAERLGIAHLMDRAVEDLSSGERQRVALAGVLVMEPRYLVSDESTAWLDPPTRAIVLALLRELASEGVGILHITHDPLEAARADRVLILDCGSVVRAGAPAEVFATAYRLARAGVRVPLAALAAELAAERSGRALRPPAFSASDLRSVLGGR